MKRKLLQLPKRQVGIVIIAIVFGFLGMVMLRLSHAGTYVVSQEAELGTANENAPTVGGAGASNSKATLFRAATSGGTGSNIFYNAVCNNKVGVTTSGKMKSSLLTEVSGIAASRTTDNAYWVHNDSGDSARIFSVNSAGDLLGIFNFSGITAIDWEDIDVGPGPVAGQSYVYASNTGDNDLERKKVQMYRIPEPNPNNNGATATVSNVETLNFTYSDNAAHNVEAVFIDPSSGEIYFVDKSDTRLGEIYKAPGNLANGSTTVMTKVGTLGYKVSGNTYEKITGADMMANGQAIAIRSYENLYVYDRPSGTTVAGALAGTGCKAPSFIEPQGEAVAFKRSNNGLVTTGEGSKQPIYNFDPK